ncbi:CBS domain-containing protein [Proteiniborus ethanoligenes]|uniref:CBS domain-containing protein n=1 Tax=Proteiniborus ethanoligenes TaxID=415015 RepID=A0A1H3SAQ5_9FIRM|nr:CBS domain-containing protein [Proteiniborus ethanoligenes]SDZ35163.1 CBS domain-containing protein [Proteiniborus ethanoligenes]
MKVKEIMTTRVQTVSESCTMKEAAEHMKSLDVGSLPVCNNSNKLVGVVTDRDMVIRGLTSEINSSTPVRQVMSSNPVFVSPDTGVHEAARLMAKHQIRRLPVVENNEIVGIVSIGDLAVRDIYVNEAGDALSSISESNNSMM